MPASTFNVTRRYAAFLSYRHADNREEGRRWAEWLHQALETYEVPRDLVGKNNQRGTPIPSSLYPVFRDEEELPADADLSQNIRRALENSDLLIVLCSPRACQSRFVAEEIRYFKELGKSDRILALMIDGEPNANDPAKATQGIVPDIECFPEPLRFGVPGTDERIDWKQRTEPIAADVRPQGRPGEGYTSAAAYRTALERVRQHSIAEIRRLEKAFAEQLDLARLKLVAGALGLPPGQLRERDAVYRARRFRRLAAILGSLALLALAAAGVAVWKGAEAVAAQKSAEHARAAEEAQKIVARRNEESARSAQADAERQKKRAETGENTAENARQRAVAAREAADELIDYLQLDLYDSLKTVGRLDLLDNVNERIRLYQQDHPPEINDQSSQAAAAQRRAIALIQRGDALLVRGQPAEAMKDYQEARDITEKMVGARNHKADLQGTWSAILLCIGNAEKAEGNLPAALKSYQESLMQAQEFAARQVGDSCNELNVSAGFIRVGDVQRAQNDLRAALKSYVASHTLLESLLKQQPNNTVWLRELSVAWNKIGSVQMAQGDLANALGSHQQSFSIVKTLADSNPGQAEWQEDLAASYQNIGVVQRAQNLLEAALTSFRASSTIYEKLAGQDAGNFRRQRDFSVSLNSVGDVQLDQHDGQGALSSYRASVEVMEKVVARDPSNTNWQSDLSTSLSNVGDLQTAVADFNAAFKNYQRCLSICRNIVAHDPSNMDYQINLMETESRAGNVLLYQSRHGEARAYFERSRAIANELVEKYPDNYSIRSSLAYYLWSLAKCTGTQSHDSREKAQLLLRTAAEALRALEKSHGLHPEQIAWLHG